MQERPLSWHVTSRLEELSGEERANVLRVLGVAVFYAIEVLNHHGLTIFGLAIPRVEGVDSGFHAMATALAAAWITVAAMVFVALRNRIFPPALKYFTTGADLFLLTSVLTLADGPRSPMLVSYFLVVALSGLRASVRLVWFATAGAVVGYLVLVADATRRRPELVVPPHFAITTVAALILCGLVIAQIVAAMRRAAARYSALERSSVPTDEVKGERATPGPERSE